MNSIWRFYVDQQGAWRWQEMSASGELVAESACEYPTYDDCVGGAQARGYRYEISQPPIPRHMGTLSVLNKNYWEGDYESAFTKPVADGGSV